MAVGAPSPAARRPGRSCGRILPAGPGAGAAGPCPVPRKAGPPPCVRREPCPPAASAGVCRAAGRGGGRGVGSGRGGAGGSRSDSTPNAAADSGSCSLAGGRPGGGDDDDRAWPPPPPLPHRPDAVGGAAAKRPGKGSLALVLPHPVAAWGSPRRSSLPVFTGSEGPVRRAASPARDGGGGRAGPGIAGERGALLISVPGRFRSSDYLRDLASERRDGKRLVPCFGYRAGGDDDDDDDDVGSRSEDGVLKWHF